MIEKEKRVSGNFNLSNLPPCLNCGSVSFVDKKEVPNSGKWAYTYKCKSCDSEHELSIGDRMGGQFDVVTLKST